ncbi:MAG: hypothetical protein KUF82_20995 [Candidatus Thiodiazotropha sp. (ex Ctena orbiculata)]|nr:hypothetical protein [Candidatus Thiodiazotropha taylori]
MVFYEWTAFLSQFFKKLPSLLSYHHFKCDIRQPDSIFVRKYANDEEAQIKLLKAGASVAANQMPKVCENEGLDSGRQWYLFEEIRPFCSSESADSVCPKPTIPKAIHEVKEEIKKKKETE